MLTNAIQIMNAIFITIMSSKAFVGVLKKKLYVLMRGTWNA